MLLPGDFYLGTIQGIKKPHFVSNSYGQVPSQAQSEQISWHCYKCSQFQPKGECRAHFRKVIFHLRDAELASEQSRSVLDFRIMRFRANKNKHQASQMSISGSCILLFEAFLLQLWKEKKKNQLFFLHNHIASAGPETTARKHEILLNTITLSAGMARRGYVGLGSGWGCMRCWNNLSAIIFQLIAPIRNQMFPLPVPSRSNHATMCHSWQSNAV